MASNLEAKSGNDEASQRESPRTMDAILYPYFEDANSRRFFCIGCDTEDGHFDDGILHRLRPLLPVLILSLYQDLTEWRCRDEIIACAGLKKVDLHTEYLGGRTAILTLASDKVTDEMKDAMAEKLKSFNPNTHIE